MDKNDVIAFFDRIAPEWDEMTIKEAEKITRIFDATGIKAGVSVLDIACGTGVLMPDYLARAVKKVVGVDISGEMIARAKEKYAGCSTAEFYCADAERFIYPEPFDCVMIYNAFPHFTEPAALIQSLSEKLVPGGRLTVAHNMGRAQLDAHHAGTAKCISNGLISETEMAALFAPYFTVDVVVSEEGIYIVSGFKK